MALTNKLVGMLMEPQHHSSKRDPVATREKLVQSAVGLILKNGFHGTGVDAICEQAGVTKGSFFHHFKSKDDIGLAVISWWSAMGTGLYSKAWEDAACDPLDQLFAMLDIMESFANRPDEPCVCAIGMMAQEMAATHTNIRQHCSKELNVWTQNVATLLKKAQLRSTLQRHRLKPRMWHGTSTASGRVPCSSPRRVRIRA
jgi:TetR/AcrR family transcriptional regulator, transcriptional repressor for nem operon